MVVNTQLQVAPFADHGFVSLLVARPFQVENHRIPCAVAQQQVDTYRELGFAGIKQRRRGLLLNPLDAEAVLE